MYIINRRHIIADTNIVLYDFNRIHVHKSICCLSIKKKKNVEVLHRIQRVIILYDRVTSDGRPKLYIIPHITTLYYIYYILYNIDI